MNRRIKIDLVDTNQIDKKVIAFFKSYGFQLMETQEGCLRFRQNSSLLDAWKTNPLKWGSEVLISLSDNTIEANFNVDTDAQMNTAEEKKVWQTFIANFKNYLTGEERNNSKLVSMISESKNRRLNYFSWAILGALTGGLLVFCYTKLTNTNSTLSLLIIPIIAIAFLRWRIKYGRAKNAI